MKILKCHIENFGKLSNFDYEFKEGLNTIKKENGFGKTTFADFIKAMFYGLEAKRTTKKLIDRKKYMPWQGGAFGGNIELEVDGKKYKVERFFGKKEADDVFRLYDLNTNLESTDFSENIGEEIFKLNREAYERSTFISGQNIETSMNDSLSAKLGNILENENDINTSEQAIKTLDEAIKNYKKTGGRGEINEKILEKSKLEKKLQQSQIDEKTLQERKEQYKKLKEKIKEKEQEKEKYQENVTDLMQQEAKKAKFDQYKILNENLEESKKNLEQYKEKIKNDNDIKNKIELNQKKSNNLSANITTLEKKIEKISTINNILLIIFLILGVLGVFLTISQSIKIGIPLCIISIIFLIIFIIKKVSLNNLKNDCINKKQEKTNLDNLNETLNNVYEKQEKEKKAEINRLENEYKIKLKMKESYENENNIMEITNVNNTVLDQINKEEIESKLNILTNELNQLNDEKNYNKNQIEILESNLDTVFDVENDIEEVSQKINEMKQNCEILEKTKKYLEKAKEQFSSHYLNNMKESFIKNLILINEKEMDIDLDVNLEAKINEQGSNKEIRYFSTGYQDLIYICMRLSLIDALFEEEKPFIILDDPFVNLDENKMKNALSLLEKLSKEYQIIYFVCHESRNVHTLK